MGNEIRFASYDPDLGHLEAQKLISYYGSIENIPKSTMFSHSDTENIEDKVLSDFDSGFDVNKSLEIINSQNPGKVFYSKVLLKGVLGRLNKLDGVEIDYDRNSISSMQKAYNNFRREIGAL